MPRNPTRLSYRDRIVLESLGKRLGHSILVLLLDDARRRCEDTERRLSLAGIRRLAKGKEHLQQLWPRVICEKVNVLVVRLLGLVSSDALLS